MAHCIDMGGAVVAQQDPSRLVRKAGSQHPPALFMRQMGPDDRFEVAGIHGHPLIYFLRKINYLSCKHAKLLMCRLES